MIEKDDRDSDESTESVIKSLSNAINSRMARPIYLKIEHHDGELAIEQVEFLTVEELALLVKVEARTVYGWLDKGLLKFCKPQGTGQNLIPLHAALHWIDSSAIVKAPKRKKAEG
jgi:excisionase family DNA binding protein